MDSKQIFTKLMMMATVLFAVACVGPYKADVNRSPLQDTERIVLLDHALTRYLKVVRSKTDRLTAGQLEIKIDIENEENADVWADMRIIFRDDDGFELETTNWEPVQFHRRAVTTIKRNSLSAKAADYRILLRKIK